MVAVRRWQPEPRPESYRTRWLDNMASGALRGRAANPSARTRSKASTNARTSGQEGTVPSWCLDESQSTGSPGSWALSNEPIAMSMDMKLNGDGLRPGTDYTIVGSTVTFSDPSALFGGISGSWMLTAQYQAYEFAASDPLAQWKPYQPVNCPSSYDYFGADGWGPIGPVTDYRPNGAQEPFPPDDVRRTSMSGFTIGASGPQSNVVLSVWCESDYTQFNSYQFVAFWASEDGCVYMQGFASGYQYLGRTPYTTTVTLTPPTPWYPAYVPYPILLRVQGMSGPAAYDASLYAINFDSGQAAD